MQQTVIVALGILTRALALTSLAEEIAGGLLLQEGVHRKQEPTASTEVEESVPVYWTSPPLPAGPGIDLPTDLPSIAGRFQEIDVRMQGLQDKFVALEGAVVQVRALATSTGATIEKSESDLTEVLDLAQRNKVAASALEEEFKATEPKVEEANVEMQLLKGTVSKVEEKALQMHDVSAKVTEKVSQLELAVKELLPGKDYLPFRIKRAQDHLDQYRQSVQSGELDPIVANTIRENFLRAQKRTEQLAGDVLQDQEDDEEDD